jgi:hypothetical protein
MTIQSKVKQMQFRMNEMRKACERDDYRRHYYSLLHDAVLFTGDRIDTLDKASLLGYIELAALVAGNGDIAFMALRARLIELGFNTAPAS